MYFQYDSSDTFDFRYGHVWFVRANKKSKPIKILIQKVPCKEISRFIEILFNISRKLLNFHRVTRIRFFLFFFSVTRYDVVQYIYFNSSVALHLTQKDTWIPNDSKFIIFSFYFLGEGSICNKYMSRDNAISKFKKTREYSSKAGICF